MPTTTRDLWPADIFTTPTVTPIAVLREQGEILGSHTQNFVHGEVETTTLKDGRKFTHTLYLLAPLLRYREPLLRVDQHQTQPYPATVVETNLTKQADQGHWSREVNNEVELRESLREFLSEPRVKEVLRSVINLSNDVAPVETA